MQQQSECSNRLPGSLKLTWWSSKAIHVFAKGLQRKLTHLLHAVHQHRILRTAVMFSTMTEESVAEFGARRRVLTWRMYCGRQETATGTDCQTPSTSEHLSSPEHHIYTAAKRVDTCTTARIVSISARLLQHCLLWTIHHLEGIKFGGTSCEPGRAQRVPHIHHSSKGFKCRPPPVRLYAQQSSRPWSRTYQPWSPCCLSMDLTPFQWSILSKPS
jgi:hypothetical protein